MGIQRTRLAIKIAVMAAGRWLATFAPKPAPRLLAGHPSGRIGKQAKSLRDEMRHARRLPTNAASVDILRQGVAIRHANGRRSVVGPHMLESHALVRQFVSNIAYRFRRFAPRERRQSSRQAGQTEEQRMIERVVA